MRLVIADTGPINYLILIGHTEILPALFEKIVLPVAVQDELGSAKAPAVVRHWIERSPAWLEIDDTPPGQPDDPIADRHRRWRKSRHSIGTLTSRRPSVDG